MSESARAVIVAAREEAGALGHDFVGTEHLLLALGEGSGTAAAALRRAGVDPAAVRRAVEARVGRGTAGAGGHRPFSPRAKKVMELGLREAIRLHQDRIGTEHLLLGLIREGEGVAAQVLVKDLGVDLGALQETVLEQLRDPAAG
jgi:ATP-dependent Clp protease ATP-binding subunit ClpC